MSYKFYCPVPKEQRPITEYITLLQSNFFNWPILTETIFKKKLLKIFFVCLSFSFLIIFFKFDISFFKLLIINAIISSFLIIFINIRLFLTWNYIQQRLKASTIFYEESSWYDGKKWLKSKSILIQEKLIQIYQVFPIIKKINNIFINICSLLITLFFLLILN